MAWKNRKPAQQNPNLFDKKNQIFKASKSAPQAANTKTNTAAPGAGALSAQEPAPVLAALPPVSNLPRWTCKVEGQPADEAGFTVGEVFDLDCSGSSSTFQEPLQIHLPKNAEYALQLLKPLDITENHVKYQMTAYRPGDHKFKDLAVVDSEGRGFLIESFELKVQSVMTGSQQQEPFGPLSPLKMPWPVWPFFTTGVILVVLVGWSLIFARRRLQKKLLEKNIKKFLSPLGSYHQFSKDLRGIKRSVIFSTHHDWSTLQVIEFLDKLSESYRLFLLREFIVPATTWRIPLIIRAIKRKDRHGFEKYKNLMLRALRELEAAKTHPATLKPADCEQLAQITWQAVDLIWKTKREGKGVQT